MSEGQVQFIYKEWKLQEVVLVLFSFDMSAEWHLLLQQSDSTTDKNIVMTITDKGKDDLNAYVERATKEVKGKCF